MKQKKVSVSECDSILFQFNQFLKKVSDEKLHLFDVKEDKLDTFFFTSLRNEKFDKLWTVIKLLLVLSYGQASVERGFSINKHLEVENMQKQTYIAKRTIQDEIKNLG